MRKELYNILCKELKEVGGGLIKHIDLWNHNVEFIEQEENWERPAVFVESARYAGMRLWTGWNIGPNRK